MGDEKEQDKGGSGKFYYPNGATYEGDWKYLEPETPVIVEEPKKGKVAAPPSPPEEDKQPLKRVRHGSGTYCDGSYAYTGDWHEDMMQGTGRFTFASTSFYEGSWESNKYQGQGKYQWADGSSYQGDWQDGSMHGKGIYTDARGHQWEGQFFNGSGPGLTCLL